MAENKKNYAILYNATGKNAFGCLECILIGHTGGKTYSLQCNFASLTGKVCSCTGFQQKCDNISFSKICSIVQSCLKAQAAYDYEKGAASTQETKKSTQNQESCSQLSSVGVVSSHSRRHWIAIENGMY